MDSTSASSEKRQQLQVATSSSSVDLDALESPTSTYSSESGIGTKSNNATDDEVIQCQGAVNNECIDVGSPFCGDLGDWCTPSRQFASTKTEEGPEHVQVPADSNTKEIEHFDFEEKTSATQATSNRSRNGSEESSTLYDLASASSSARNDSVGQHAAIKSNDSKDSGESRKTAGETSSSGNSESDDEGGDDRASFVERYASAVKIQHRIVLTGLQWLSHRSALHPKRTIAISVFLSFALLVIGFFTNFHVFTDENVMWVPQDSLSVAHNNWIGHGKFPGGGPTSIIMLFHGDGENILTKDNMALVFEALDTLHADAASSGVCKGAILAEPDPPVGQCSATGVTEFWNNTSATFEEEVTSDFDLQVDMSALFFPHGNPVPIDSIVGFPEYDDTTGVLTSAESFFVLFNFYNGTDWEPTAVETMLNLRDKWAANPNVKLRLTVQANSSLGAELARAIEEDIPLVPLVFIIMATFTAVVFFKPHGVFSRSSLGVAAVVAILLSIMSGFGLVFIFGVPFTTITQLLPFLLFGIGLDDAFIVMGAYERTDRTMSPADRIAETVDEIGLSITLTTMTSAMAFGLGGMSSVPAIYWLCMYSFPTILLVFLYQMTFFVACIVLDEQRIMAGRKDIFFCFQKADGFNYYEESKDLGIHLADRIMGVYARFLLRPRVKMVAVACFATMFAFFGWRASLFEQKFKFTDVLPRDSYVTEFTEALEVVRPSTLTAGVYFRDVDQTNETVQQQMQDYWDALDQIEGIQQTGRLWLNHFNLFINFNGANDLPFNEQLDMFFTNDIFHQLYFGDIGRDDEGNIVSSRTTIEIDIDLSNVNEMIRILREQDRVSREFITNQGLDRYAFFTFDSIYLLWEFFAIAVGELVLTTLVGIGAVTLVALIFIPHWTASVIVLPFICVLYVDLLGFMQLCGVHINAVSYVALAMSIGLLVDFIMHILFRYYECNGNRREKTEEMLKTMGASILLGGTSTFLGTIPLMFSSTDIFEIVFITFLGIVLFGMSHGLVLLPIILDTFGPEDQVTMSNVDTKLSTSDVNTKNDAGVLL